MTPDGPIVQADFDALLELLDRHTMREIVAIFVESCPPRIETVRNGLAAGDLKVVATTYHTMRSGCGQLGAHDLEALCAQAEQAAKAGSAADAAMMLGRIEAELSLVLAWFREQGWMDA